MMMMMMSSKTPDIYIYISILCVHANNKIISHYAFCSHTFHVGGLYIYIYIYITKEKDQKKSLFFNFFFQGISHFLPLLALIGWEIKLGFRRPCGVSGGFWGNFSIFAG